MGEYQIIWPFQINRENYDRLESKFSIAKQIQRQLDFDIETYKQMQYNCKIRVNISRIDVIADTQFPLIDFMYSIHCLFNQTAAQKKLVCESHGRFSNVISSTYARLANNGICRSAYLSQFFRCWSEIVVIFSELAISLNWFSCFETDSFRHFGIIQIPPLQLIKPLEK